jgi:hypothetical protein
LTIPDKKIEMQDTESSVCTTQENWEYYRTAAMKRQRLALVTGGALLGIKSIGAHPEHVVALDADAVKNGAGDGLELR